jgi:hypothetical protein
MLIGADVVIFILSLDTRSRRLVLCVCVVARVRACMHTLAYLCAHLVV